MRSAFLKITQAFILSLIYIPTVTFSQGNSDATDDIIRKQESERTQEIERMRQQELDKTYSKRLESDTSSPQYKLHVVDPTSINAFKVRNFIFLDTKGEALPKELSFLERAAKRKRIQFANPKLLKTLLGQLTLELYSRGYVTTSLHIPTQTYQDGIVYIEVITGRVNQLLTEDPKAAKSFKMVLPRVEEKILNYRNLENGLDRIERLNSYSTEFQIAPSKRAGFSDVICRIKRSKAWTGNLSYDDSYVKALGEHTLRAKYSYDNPLGLADFISLGGSTVVSPPKFVKRYGNSIHYGIPYSRTLTTFNGSWNYSSIPLGNTHIASETKSTGLNLDWSYLGYRSKYFKSEFGFNISHYRSRKFIGGLEQAVSRKKTTSFLLRYNMTVFFGKSSINATLSGKIGVPWFGSQKDNNLMSFDDPTYEYKIYNLNLVYTTRGNLFKTIPINWTTVLNGQYTNDTLYGAEQFTIGSRYSVRGFGDEFSTSAENGLFIRNECTFPLQPIKSVKPTFYLGADYGFVSGFSDKYNTDKELSGAFVGLRLRWKSIYADFTWSEPIQSSVHRNTLDDRFTMNISYSL